MDERTVTIDMLEYKELIETSIRVQAFKDFVNRSEYSIDRYDCGAFLGFKPEKKNDGSDN